MAQNINLYTARPVRAPALLSRATVIGLPALIAASAFALHQLTASDNARLRADLARVQAETQRLERVLTEVPSPTATEAEKLAIEEKEVAGLESIASRLSAGALGRSGGFIDHLKAFGRTTVEGVWLTAIRLENTGGSLVIEGKAVEPGRLPALLAALRTEPLFAGTAFAAIEVKASEDKPAGSRQQHADVVRFRIQSTDARTAAAPVSEPRADKDAKSAAVSKSAADGGHKAAAERATVKPAGARG